jgi:hypothetical protein
MAAAAASKKTILLMAHNFLAYNVASCGLKSKNHKKSFYVSTD